LWRKGQAPFCVRFPGEPLYYLPYVWKANLVKRSMAGVTHETVQESFAKYAIPAEGISPLNIFNCDEMYLQENRSSVRAIYRYRVPTSVIHLRTIRPLTKHLHIIIPCTVWYYCVVGYREGLYHMGACRTGIFLQRGPSMLST
jgi:hypothetical protein